MQHPVCKIRPTATLLEHSEKAALPSQTKAVKEFRAAEAVQRTAETQWKPSSSRNSSPEPATSAPAIPPNPGAASLIPHVIDNTKRPRVEESFENNDSADDEREDVHTNPKHEYDH